MTEKFYMACDSCKEGLKAEYGPFRTSGEAEDNSRRLGWTWVCVYTHTLNEAGAITDVKTRYYEIAPGIDKLRSVISGVKPLDAQEQKFFAQYEKQMAEPTESLYTRIKKGLTKLGDMPPQDMELGGM